MQPSTPAGRRPPTQADRISVVVATDDAYAYPTSVMVASLVATARPSRQIDLYVIADEMGMSALDRLRQALNVTSRRAREQGVEFTFVFLSPDTDRLADFRPRGHISEATYLRLLIPDLLPNIDRAIYLDGDILICDDIGSLWTSDLEGAPVGAILNENRPTIAEGIEQHAERSGPMLPPQAPYMNSGVMVLDLDRWRSQQIVDRTVQDLHDHLHLYPLLDQDALNAVLVGNWTALATEWNVQAGARASTFHRGALGDISALHFTSRFKPWAVRFAQQANPDRVGRYKTYQSLFFTSAKQSGWFTPAEWQAYRWGFRQRDASARLARAVKKVRGGLGVRTALRRALASS